ncbi:MAG: TIR domain-containing protein [Lachnospiraceae bacterium]|nr:TIR domain-containing protein [Lachnospiraceae bacterium]
METYSYRAFISYRHISPDEDIAKKLHTLIENYSVPRDVQTSAGIKRMGRVFRDQEELPLSTDLGNDIRAALENSEWLIVLCSPEYLKSKWCKAELDHFISLGRRDHILAVLVSGEPVEAFPEQLRYIERDGEKIEVEPLAGDVRAENIQASLKKLNEEKLRILAPMLGVNFDHLRQRARRRKRRITAAAVSACLAVLAGFLIFALVKNGQITEQRNIAMENQLKLLIEQANTYSDEGNKLLAANTLLEAAEIRKTAGEDSDEQFAAALEYALYNDDFETVLTLDNENRKFGALIFSHNDKYLAGITNMNSAVLIDAATGKILYTVSRSDTGELDSVGFTQDDRYFYTVDSWYGFVSLYDVETGQLYRQYDDGSEYTWTIGEKVFALSDGRIVIVQDKKLIFWDYEADTYETGFEIKNETIEGYTRPFCIDISPDEEYLVTGSHGYGTGMKVMALDGSEDRQLEFDPERGYSPIMYSGDGNYIAALSGSMYFVWDAHTGKIVQSGTADASVTGLDRVRINYDGSIILISMDDCLEAIDVKTGSTLWEKRVESNVTTDVCISPDGRYVGASGGINGIFDIRSGAMLCEKYGTAFSNDSGKVLCGSFGPAPELCIMPDATTQRTVADFDEELFEIPRYTNPADQLMISLRHNCSELYSTPPGNAGRQAAAYTDTELKYLAYTHYDGFIEIFDIGSQEGAKDLYCLAEHCYYSVTDLTFSGDMMASCGGYDPRCVLFDLKSGQITHVLTVNEYAHGCEFSKDGSKIIILGGRARNEAFVYSVQTGNLLYKFTAREGTAIERVGFNNDGTLCAAVLDDGSAIVGDLYPTIDDLIDEAEKR